MYHILEKKEIIETHSNGKIKYVETKAIIHPIWIALCPNHRINDDGKLMIRIGVNKKFRFNGDLEWEIKYDDFGNVVKH
jgi:hypothetical protein